MRALTFRSADTYRMAEVYRQIMDLKKDAAKKEAERKEMADVIEQEDLIPIKGRRPHRLGDVYVRPQLDGKRLPGELEIHTNGIRYQSIKSDNSFSKWSCHLACGSFYSTAFIVFQMYCSAMSSISSSSPVTMNS